ncbi:MAG: glycosyltransferase family 1 protein [Pyramidobacter sp.]|nr:glycosyltransferase family 1 protein [Pyramidobacter sp.]
MKKIIINRRFLTQRITGVQRYAREIIAELDKIAAQDEIEMAVPPETKDIPPYRRIKVVRVGRLRSRLWEQISYPAYVWRKNGVGLSLCNTSPLIKPGIVCLHDMKIKAAPQFFSAKFLLWYRLLFWNAARRADRLITVSEFSKSEIVRYCCVSPDMIEVIPNGWQHYERIRCDERARLKYNLEKDRYYFAMSSLEPNKNFAWIAQAALDHPNDIFAVAGAINERVFRDGIGFECPPNMKLLGYVSDEEAKALMRDCRAFLFPSFYEGFGIPPLEALSAGAKNIVVSDIPVMHEVFGNSAAYVPTDYTGVVLPAHGRVQADNLLKKYSWSSSAAKLYELLKRSA